MPEWKSVALDGDEPADSPGEWRLRARAPWMRTPREHESAVTGAAML